MTLYTDRGLKIDTYEKWSSIAYTTYDHQGVGVMCFLSDDFVRLEGKDVIFDTRIYDLYVCQIHSAFSQVRPVVVNPNSAQL